MWTITCSCGTYFGHLFDETISYKHCVIVKLLYPLCPMSKEIPVWEPDVYLMGTARTPNLWLWWWSRWRHLIRCNFKHSYPSQKVIPPWHGIKWKWMKWWPELIKNPSCATGFRDLPSMICIEVVVAYCASSRDIEAADWDPDGSSPFKPGKPEKIIAFEVLLRSHEIWNPILQLVSKKCRSEICRGPTPFSVLGWLKSWFLY